SDGTIIKALLEIDEGIYFEENKALSEHLLKNKIVLDKTIKKIVVLSKTGTIIASTDLSAIGKDLSKETFFKRGLLSPSVTDTTTHLGGKPYIVISTPVKNRASGEVIGILANYLLLSELNEILKKVFFIKLGALSSHTHDYRTFDAYIVNRDKVMITDSIFIERAILKQRVDTKPVRACIESGTEVTGFYRDYRGVPVGGASMCLTMTGWTLIVKIDEKEIMSPTKYMLRDAIIAMFILGGIIFVMFIFFNRTVVTPIRRIADASKELAKGNYDINIPVKSKDEIGALSDAFNYMVSEINNTATAYMKSEASLKVAQQIAHIGNWEWYINDNTISWSDEAYRIFGYKPGEIDLNYEVFLSHVHPDDVDYVKEAVNAAIERKIPYKMNHRIIRRDEKERTVQEQAQVYFDKKGNVSKMIGTVQDVTEERLAEEKIRKSYQSQQAITSILKLSLRPLSLDEQLNRSLDVILSMPWLAYKSKGSIYLVGNEPDLLELKGGRNITEEQIKHCSKIPFGKCICGRAAAEGETLFVSTIDERHDIIYEGMEPHGHYCVPIKSGSRIMGIINVYLKEGHIEDRSEKEFLSAAANTLAGIIERKEAEHELKKLSATIEHSINIVLITDVNGNIEYVNKTFEEITGYSRNEAIGQNPRILSSGESNETVYEELWDAILRGNVWEGELKNRRKNGQYFWVRSLISPIKDESGKITHFLAIQADITDRIQSQEMVEYFATHDELTGLVNRQRFMDLLKEWMYTAKSFGHKGTLLMVDIDEFKYINDNFGHVTGDDYLRRTANLLNKLLLDLDEMHKVSQSSFICRAGGDEFVIFLPMRGEKEGLEAAELIRGSIGEFRIGEMQFSTTASIGIVLFPDHGEDMKQLFSKGDAALYRARELGYNKCHLYSSDDKYLEEIHTRVDWKRKVEKALSEDRFELWFQPILNLKQDEVHHYEVLVRMRDEGGKILLPGAFINVAEEVGLIGRIDRMVTEKAIKLQSRLFAKGMKITLSVNLSGKDLGNEMIFNFLKETIEAKGADPSHLVFEITETAAVRDLNRAVKFINDLKKLGCRFSLDDFGVGFTSFVYLREMNVDYIKIDGSFIRNLHKNKNDQIVVKSITDVAKGMGVKTVAEFVEKEETLELLRAYDVDYAQGYLIGKPSPRIEKIKRG
ncbi:MAG: EAL domain-containing protein, partial [Deltaproteobacteria bacterium]|nr:EAL domain-containing protein [Deltaproteobacteria bacterium]